MWVGYCCEAQYGIKLLLTLLLATGRVKQSSTEQGTTEARIKNQESTESLNNSSPSFPTEAREKENGNGNDKDKETV